MLLVLIEVTYVHVAVRIDFVAEAVLFVVLELPLVYFSVLVYCDSNPMLLLLANFSEVNTALVLH